MFDLASHKSCLSLPPLERYKQRRPSWHAAQQGISYFYYYCVVLSSFEEYMVVAVEGTISSTTGSSFMTDEELHILEELLMLSYNELNHCPSDLEKDGVIIVYNMDAIGFIQAKENVWNKNHHVESFFTFVMHGTCTDCEHQDWLFGASNEKKPSMCQCS
jgi:hypothetical protein